MVDTPISSPAAASPPHPFDVLLQLDQRCHARTPVKDTGAQLSEIRGRLALRLAGWNLLFSMDDVAEIIPVPRTITRVPGVKRWLLGIANLRGKVISVSDLRDFLVDRPTPRLPSSQILVLRSADWDYGLLVDEIIGMRHFGPQHRLPSLEVLEPKLRPYVIEGFLNENMHWLAFNTAKLFTDQRFLNAEN